MGLKFKLTKTAWLLLMQMNVIVTILNYGIATITSYT